MSSAVLTRLPRVPLLRPGWPAAEPPALPAPRRYPFGYFLFILLNITLFIRPGDIAPELDALPSYELLIIACFACSLPAVLEQLSRKALRRAPITIFMFGLLVAVAASHLLSPLHFFFIWGARMSAYKFFKVVVYYLLLVGLMDSPARLRNFMTMLGVFIVALNVVTLLQFYEVIQLPNIDVAFQQTEFDEGENPTGEKTLRLQSTGMFADPNDFCLALVTGMVMCLYAMGNLRAGPVSLIWLPGLISFGYSLFLTRSRGGFLAMIGALLAFFYSRFGWVGRVVLTAVAVPLVFVAFAGRSTELTSSSGTGLDRIKLWSEALDNFRQAPLFGIGEGEFTEVTDDHKVAHNSFIQNYAELGFFGGSLFVAAFAYAIGSLYRLRPPDVYIPDPELRRLRPFLFTLLIGYVAGLMSLSRAMVVPTYIPLGLTAAYLRLTTTFPPRPPVPLTFRLALRMLLVSSLFLAGMYAFVRARVPWA
jgi:O-antigen ligase